MRAGPEAGRGECSLSIHRPHEEAQAGSGAKYHACSGSRKRAVLPSHDAIHQHELDALGAHDHALRPTG
jgi:hypothetical protein